MMSSAMHHPLPSPSESLDGSPFEYKYGTPGAALRSPGSLAALNGLPLAALNGAPLAGLTASPLNVFFEGLAGAGRSRGRVFEKLAFWRQRRKTAADVHAALAAAAKAHERYRTELLKAHDTMHDWTRAISEFDSPLKRAIDDASLGKKVAQLLDAARPMLETERRAGDTLTKMANSFQSLGGDEDELRRSLARGVAAHRHKHRALAKSEPREEMGRIEQDLVRLTNDIDSAADRLRLSIRRELPQSFEQMAAHYDEVAHESSRASQNLNVTIRDEFGAPATPCGTMYARHSAGMSGSGMQGMGSVQGVSSVPSPGMSPSMAGMARPSHLASPLSPRIPKEAVQPLQYSVREEAEEEDDAEQAPFWSSSSAS